MLSGKIRSKWKPGTMPGISSATGEIAIDAAIRKKYNKIRNRTDGGIHMICKPFQNITLSALGMGAMRLPMKDKDHIDYEKAHDILDRAYAGGINYYDTAYVYQGGDSERCLGAWHQKYPRDSFYIASKFFLDDEYDVRAVFEEQLERLQTDYIDFYLLHCITDRSADKYLSSGAIEFFEEQKRLGRIKYLGFSSHSSPETLARIADHRAWDFVQIQMNYYDWVYGTAAQEYAVLESRNIPIMVMEPVRGGRLASLTPETEQMLKSAHPDWSVASWALRFVRSHPQVQVILSGMSDLDQMADNLSTFTAAQGLTEADMQLLLQVLEQFKKQVQVPCTACRYCVPECPMGISIPDYLAIYNDYKVNGAGELRRMEQVESEGKPTDCIGCGACAGHCPQNIDIPAIMAELASHN